MEVRNNRIKGDVEIEYAEKTDERAIIYKNIRITDILKASDKIIIKLHQEIK